MTGQCVRADVVIEVVCSGCQLGKRWPWCSQAASAKSTTMSQRSFGKGNLPLSSPG